MSDSNDKTIGSYEESIEEYIEGTPPKVIGERKDWIDKTLKGLEKDAKILELGSAFGRDAKYIESQGYEVECSDVVDGFIAVLKDQGFNTRRLNAITDEYGTGYDLVFADAVLLHFNKDEAKEVAKRAFTALKPGGWFSVRTKYGDGEEWSTEKIGKPRYFRYWHEETMRELLEGAGFSEIEVSISTSDYNETEWLKVIATK